MANANSTFDPNAPASPGDGLFGLPYTEANADIVILPVSWDITSSYGYGSADGPEAILTASHQVDLCDHIVDKSWQTGIYMLPTNTAWQKQNLALISASTAEINAACEQIHQEIYQKCKTLIGRYKGVGILGGDHSCSFGLIKALAEEIDFGILQIDAHADLRPAYEGHEYSHASIMHNALTKTNVYTLIQVGIRDYCDQELATITENKDITTYFQEDINKQKFAGRTWNDIVADIVAGMPSKFYVSFDIDGLDPKYCPNTGTPVPDGLGYYEALYIVEQAVKAGKEMIGFDLCEVAPGEDEWDANVGARVLYRLANLMAVSKNLSQWRI